MENRVASIHNFGQSIWLDNIDRDQLQSGGLKKLVDDGEIYGLTSNPTIFDNAISKGTAYDDAFRTFITATPNAGLKDIYEHLAIKDIQDAADALRPVFDQFDGKDGFVSLEVSPLLARDTAGTIEEAQRLWAAVDRANLMIKIPATKEGLPAITKVISEGINVNATLMFSLQDYIDVSEAFIAGLEQRSANGGAIDHIHSVASFFVSRIDAAVDAQLPDDSPLRGKIAIANAKVANEKFEEVFSSDRFQSLEKQGGNIQRILWASTGTKDPSYSDVLYIEELIGPNSVNTAPPKTIDNFRDHGVAALRVTDNLEEAKSNLASLEESGISLNKITTDLQEAGVISFEKSFKALLANLEDKKAKLLASA